MMRIATQLRHARLLAAAFLVLVGTLASAGSGAGAQGFDAAPLAGQLLIASPAIGDPRFYHAVILMIRHDKNGAFGIVINRPVGTRSIKGLLASSGEKDADVSGRLRVFAGGPVQPRRGFVIHSAEYRDSGTHPIAPGVALTANRTILRDIGRGRGPKKILFALGYAGWGAGQLESELARHDWYMAVAGPKLIFDDERDGLWHEAMERRTREL